MTDEPDPATLKQIERAIRKLPRLQREIFLAVRLDDMSYAEIAERTGLSTGEVGRLLAKALLNFVRHLERVPPRRWWQL
ncbi:sigma factor-like helix-turn-helix DNA-binding protein [Sphingomonas sp.]|uniref:sigma-70 region 4 domain-containing protein n=1 Tax=Sphingomonas sp. TaxID=28214 RepID=UPI003D6C9DDE